MRQLTVICVIFLLGTQYTYAQETQRIQTYTFIDIIYTYRELILDYLENYRYQVIVFFRPDLVAKANWSGDNEFRHSHSSLSIDVLESMGLRINGGLMASSEEDLTTNIFMYPDFRTQNLGVDASSQPTPGSQFPLEQRSSHAICTDGLMYGSIESGYLLIDGPEIVIVHSIPSVKITPVLVVRLDRCDSVNYSPSEEDKLLYYFGTTYSKVLSDAITNRTGRYDHVISEQLNDILPAFSFDIPVTAYRDIMLQGYYEYEVIATSSLAKGK